MKVRSRRGQVIIMVTLVLIVMCGMLGLAVDLGWSYYVRKAANAATDAAALAAVIEAHSHIGSATYTCGPYVTCQPTPITCSSSIPSPPGGTNNLDNGCLYAQKHPYGVGSSGEWDNIMLSADVPPSTPDCDGIGIWPNAPAGERVCVHYWATARAYEGIPQLFSAVMGNVFGGSSARSTAAIVDAVVPGSLYALNGEKDPGYKKPGGISFEQGVGLKLGGNASIDAGGGVFVASQADGGKKGADAIEGNGTTLLTGSSINIYGTGTADPKGNYDPDPVNNSNYSLFEDPMSGKGQPAAPSSSAAPERAITGIDGPDCGNPRVMPPGSYYVVDNKSGAPTGGPIRVTGCVTFSAGGNTTWGDYVFFGGLNFPSPHTTVTFGPGRYIMAGAKGTNPVFSVANGVTLQDMTPLDGKGSSVPPINQGEIFVFTDDQYPGLYKPAGVQSVLGQLDFGYVDVQMGNDPASAINLHGLNREFALPDNLRNFTPTVFWMDQRNSQVLYDSNGNVLLDSDGKAQLNPDKSIEPYMDLQAGPDIDLYGLVYLPRGAYLDMQGSPDMTSPVRIIVGAINVQGGGTINMQEQAPFVYVTKITLIE